MSPTRATNVANSGRRKAFPWEFGVEPASHTGGMLLPSEKHGTRKKVGLIFERIRDSLQEACNAICLPWIQKTFLGGMLEPKVEHVADACDKRSGLGS